MIQQIDKSTIGIDLLKMLMLQLYSNPRCIYREYVQNSLDSINEAVRLGVLKRVKDGHVSISISSNSIVIEDNGTGIKCGLAVKYLTDIANSVKNGIDTAGLYGVGRLSGGGYCEILEFDTSYQGEKLGTIVTVDTRKLRNLLDKNRNDISAEEAMREICTTQTYEVDEDKHYFIVKLKNIINSADILLNQDDILQYIKEVAPIDYSVTFNSMINSSSQLEFVERHKKIDKIKVSINEITDIEKSYGLVVQGSGDPIEKIRYFELPTHEKYGKMGWGWYAVTDFSIQISDEKDSCAGIRLRKHNISLDKNILNSCFKESRGNKYFYGEIFVTNDRIQPDSGRQGLAASEEADALMKSIKDYFKILHLVYNKASRLKSKLKSIQDVLDKMLETSDDEVIKILISRLSEVVQDFEKSATKESHEEINDVVYIYKNKYITQFQKEVNKLLNPKISAQDNDFTEQDGRSDNKSKDLETVRQENEVPTLSDNNPNRSKMGLSTSSSEIPDKTFGGLNGSSDVVKEKTGPKFSQPSSINRKKNESVDDLLQQLIEKGIYTSEQLVVLRKVLNMMLVVCPSAKKKSLSILIQSAIASLE